MRSACRLAGRQVRQRVHRRATTPDLEMQPGGGRTRHPQIGDSLSPLDGLSLSYKDLVVVCIDGHIVVRVFDDDQFAVVAQPVTAVYDLTIVGCPYRISDIAG